MSHCGTHDQLDAGYFVAGGGIVQDILHVLASFEINEAVTFVDRAINRDDLSESAKKRLRSIITTDLVFRPLVPEEYS